MDRLSTKGSNKNMASPKRFSVVIDEELDELEISQAVVVSTRKTIGKAVH